jgi:transcriptional regulator with XRE-family HTH domain
MRLGARLKQLRTAKEMTQVQLARRLKVTQGYIAQLEGGYDKAPSLAMLRRLARALKCKVSELVE